MALNLLLHKWRQCVKNINQIDEIKTFITTNNKKIFNKIELLGCNIDVECKKVANAHLKEKSVYLRVIIRPYDLSRNSAIKLCTFKSFAYKVAKPKRGKKSYYILRLNNIILKIYLKIIYLRLKFFKKDFFKDNIIDLFFKICFSSDFNLKQNVYKGHDISWIPILLIAVVMLITAIISAYWDITISRDLGWW